MKFTIQRKRDKIRSDFSTPSLDLESSTTRSGNTLPIGDKIEGSEGISEQGLGGGGRSPQGDSGEVRDPSGVHTGSWDLPPVGTHGRDGEGSGTLYTPEDGSSRNKSLDEWVRGQPTSLSLP